MKFKVQKLVLPHNLASITPGVLPDHLLTDIKPGGKLHPLAADAWHALRAHAFANGIKTFKPTGNQDTYRSLTVQRAGFLARYQTEVIAGASTKQYDNKTWYLKPGNAPMMAPNPANPSRHMLGLAVDVSEANGDRLEFMISEMGKYGWSHELDAEPWHIFYYPGDNVPEAVKAFKLSQIK
jgi:LAS superfamily LD-carboxypeptidase LdcB